MTGSVRFWTGWAIVALGLAGCGADRRLPPAPMDAATGQRAQQAFVQALQPRRPGRPVVVVMALNEGTETTDFLLPHAVLQRSGVAEVHAVAPRRGRVLLYPALQVDVAQDLAGFDQAHPAGADYVIVPAMINDDDPAVTAWLRAQSGKGATIFGICSGALVLGRAGLLDGRRFASHWYYLDTLRERHPGATYVPHQRYVFDRGVATTTGISASVPAMLALVEAIGGSRKAHALAADLGVASWSPVHDSAAFGLDAARRASYVLNKLAFWRHERWSVGVHDGMDDVSLALAVDAWSRTGRAGVEAAAAGPVTLRSGMLLAAQPAAQGLLRLPLAPALRPMQQLDRTLCDIAQRHGTARRDWVMLELEYPGPAGACTG
jgi:putative intracellular protease/amidase